MDKDQNAAKKRSSHRAAYAIFALLLLSALGFGGFFFYKYQDALQREPNRESQRITQAIEKVVALPDEEPVLSTVQDKSKLTNTALRVRAENGDKLLIYSKAKRLIIYRPSTKKVVDMLTIQGAPSDVAAPAQSQP